jgi:DNA relaxase NicK
MTEGGIGIGWMQGTTRTASLAAVLDALGAEFGEVETRARGLQWYSKSWAIGTAGVVVGAWPRSKSSPPGELFVIVPQGALDALGWAGQMRVLALLEDGLGVRLSRLDVYRDDLARHADPADVLAAVEAGNTRSRVKAWKVYRDSAGGMTTYLGSRTGEFMVRVYRKWVEARDDAQGVRWEAEAKGERAPLVAALLRAAAEPGVAYMALLRAFCDFVDREDATRGDRAPLLGWWAALVDTAARVPLVLGRVKDSLARRRAWFVRQCAPTLALLFAVDGSEGVSEIIRDAWDRAPWALDGPAHGWDRAGAVASA